MGDLPAWLAQAHQRATGAARPRRYRDLPVRGAAPAFPMPQVQPWERQQRQQREQRPGASAGAMVGNAYQPPPLIPRDVPEVPEGRPQYWLPRVPARANPPREAPAFPLLPPGSQGPVVPENPIDMGARVSGAPAGYLRALSGQEGGDNPTAQNPKSTARGLSQFTEGTFLDMLNRYGDEYGLPDGLSREERLSLRDSPQWSMLLGGELFNESEHKLSTGANRGVAPAEVYAYGHFLGEDAGRYVLRLIEAGGGGRNAREVIRGYYGNSPAQRRQAERVIEQNPGLFTPQATIGDVMARQQRDFTAHGVQRGVNEEELTRRRPRR